MMEWRAPHSLGWGSSKRSICVSAGGVSGDGVIVLLPGTREFETLSCGGKVYNEAFAGSAVVVAGDASSASASIGAVAGAVSMGAVAAAASTGVVVGAPVSLACGADVCGGAAQAAQGRSQTLTACASA